MKVTIGIGFYNCASTIELTIKSIFAQSYKDWELILIDDGSTDDSVNLLKKIKDPRVRVISDGTRRRIAYRLNQLADEAQGEYFARMDADDLMHPERLAKQLSYFKKNKEVDIVGTNMFLIDHRTKLCGMAKKHMPLTNISKLIEESLYYQPTVMARTQWFRDNRYNSYYYRAQDMELWCRAVVDHKTNFGYLDDYLMFYRKTGIDSLDKTIETYRFQRSICLKYGPKLAGMMLTSKSYIKAHCLGVVHRVFGALNLRETLCRSRDYSINDFDKRLAEEALNKIWTCSVPGWDNSELSRTA